MHAISNFRVSMDFQLTDILPELQQDHDRLQICNSFLNDLGVFSVQDLGYVEADDLLSQFNLVQARKLKKYFSDHAGKFC